MTEQTMIERGGPVDVDGQGFDVFEQAAEIMAIWLARFRDDLAEPTENDRLTAGHLAGALWANHLLAAALPDAALSEKST